MAITSGVTLTKLSSQETNLKGYTHKAVIPYTLVSSTGGAATTATIAILDSIQGDEVQAAGFRLDTAFVTSDGTSCTLQVGDGSDTDRFIAAKELLGAATEILNWSSNASTMPYAYEAADTIDALFTVSGGSTPLCNELTAGQVTIFLKVANTAAL